MRKLSMLIMISIVLALGGCDESIEDPGCDLFTGSATASGVAYDFEDLPLAEADVEFTIADTTQCAADFRYVVGRGRTDVDGRYEVALRAGNLVVTRCVFGRVVGSDSVSAGPVSYTYESEPSEPLDNDQLELDLTDLSWNPSHFALSVSRIPGHAIGPH